MKEAIREIQKEIQAVIDRISAEQRRLDSLRSAVDLLRNGASPPARKAVRFKRLGPFGGKFEQSAGNRWQVAAALGLAGETPITVEAVAKHVKGSVQIAHNCITGLVNDKLVEVADKAGRTVRGNRCHRYRLTAAGAGILKEVGEPPAKTGLSRSIKTHKRGGK